MILEYIQIFNSKSKYIAIAVVLITIALVKIYLDKNLGSAGALIMYTIDSPRGVSVELKDNIDFGVVDILVDKGEKLATQKFINKFSDITELTPLAPSINIRPATDTPLLKQSFSMAIKVKLPPNQLREKIHILFHTRKPNGKRSIGVFTKESFNIIKNTLTFTTNNFGNYQLVTLPTILKKNLQIPSNLPLYKIKNNRLSIIYTNWSE